MKPARATLSLVIVLLLLFVFFYKKWQEPRVSELFHRHPDELIYTKHALCRMGCRNISKHDIDEILTDGVININKSNRRAQPCPVYALQGRTSGGDNLRVIFAQCERSTLVVSCYNLDLDPPCDCPVNSKTQ